MNEKLFKHIEQVVNNNQNLSDTSFDEDAWNRMQLLLDNKEQKKRPLFWIWLIAGIISILGIGVFLVLNKEPVNHNLSKNLVSKNALPKVMTNSAPTKNVAKIKIDTHKKVSAKTTEPPVKKSLLNLGIALPKPIQAYTKPVKNSVYSGAVKLNSTDFGFKNLFGNESQLEQQQTSIYKNLALAPENNKNGLKNIIKDSGNKAMVAQQSQPADQKITLVKKKNKKKPSSSVLSKVFFTGQAGLGFSATKMFYFKNNKAQFIYEFGLGYQLGKRFSVQTGISIGHKKYWAKGSHYRTGSNPYWANKEIVQVDADCYVYEIPLLFTYNFKQQQKTNYFVQLGLSSFIMKNESYQYDYYRTGNAYLYHSKYSYTGNTHLFSNINLGMGAEKKLTSKLAIFGQGTLGIPVKGVGEGAVKLFTTEASIGIKYFPFKKK